MILIILCHLFQFYDNEICKWLNVGVQLFFVISGWLYSTKQIDNPILFIIHSFRKILVPYWIFLTISIILYLIFFPNYISTTDIVLAIFCAGTIKGLGHLWFVGYILFCYLLTPYLYWLKKYLENQYLIKSLIIYFIIFVLVQILGFAFHSYFVPYRVSCFIIGYFIGDIELKITSKMKCKMVISIVIFALIMNIARIFLRYMVDGRFDGPILTVFVLYSHMLLGIALFLFLKELLKHLKYSTILYWSDNISYHFYLVHVFFILSPFTLMNYCSISSLNWLIVILSSVTFACCLRRIDQGVSKVFDSRK